MEAPQKSERETFLNGTIAEKESSEMSSKDGDDEKTPKREQWTRKIDFLFACVGFSVGLGNVWRFPYLCYKNGGGAFLLPYFTCVLLSGIPIFFLEVSVGQFMNSGGLRAWNICPLLYGIGYSSTIIVCVLNIYYNIIMTWGLYYLFSSFTSVLPWSTCNNEWNTCNCRSVYSTGENKTDILRPECYLLNATVTNSSNTTRRTDAVDEFWERKVLAISAGIEEVGVVKWDLALTMLVAWVAVYFCIWKGIKTSGKVMYFTAPAPYVLMLILLVRGCTLDGAVDGIAYYMTPDFEKIGSLQVWVDAGSQVFFSYSLGFGTLNALGSFNTFNHNSARDSVIFGCINSGTSILAGFVIFSVLGYMAKEQGVAIGDVASSGPGLAFIAYPKALAQLPLSPLWAALFFFMIILLGLDSQFVGVEGFMAAITDVYPRFFQKKWNREIILAVTCLLSFFLGLTMITQGGMYVFQLVDFYFMSRNIVIIALAECIAVSYVYGITRFEDNIETMLGFRIKFPILRIMWAFVTPIFVLVIFILGSVTYTELTYDRDYEYPKWAIGIGWAMSVVAIILIPAVMLIGLAMSRGSLRDRWLSLIRPRLHHPRQLRPQDSPSDLISDSKFCSDIDLKEQLSTCST